MSEQEPERWVQIWDAWPGFRVSWDGNFYADARKSPSGRNQRAQPIATTTTDDGYVLVKYLGKDGKRVTRQAHRVVLENFEFKGAPIPEGLQSRHYDDVGTHNRWRPGTEEESRKAGGNLGVGNGTDQHRDKVRNNGGNPLPVSPPAHDCINHVRCGGKTRNPGKRCVPCVEQVGRDAGDMLRDGENLMKVAEHFGYQRTDWVFSLAQKHGGFTGTKEQAHAQRRKRSQRVATTVRGWLGGGNAESQPAAQTPPRQPGRAGTAPFGRPSPDRKVEQTGASWGTNVAERDTREVARDTPKVTERRHYAYPAELVAKRDERTERTRGGTSRRSR
jgi:hypothetical protein